MPDACYGAGVAFGAPALTAPVGDLTAGTSNPALSDKVCNQGDFAFAIDLSSSIGTEGNFAPEKAGAKGFADAFQTAGGDGIYAGTYFNGDSAHTFTDGFVAPDTFKSGVDGLPNPSDYTPTAAGITTAAGNTGAGDRSGVSNVLFVITDGSPNRPPSGGNLNDASTWLTGANAAIDAANTARSQGWVVKAIYVGEPDPSLPFSTSDRAVWVDAVMKAIGGGSVTELSNFSSLVNGLLISVGCPTPPPAEPPTTATTAPATTAPATTAPAPTGPAPTAPATTAPAPSQSLEGASVSPSQGVEGVTSAPTVTPASTSIGGTTGGSSGSSLFPLLVALVFGAFGLMAAAVQRRSARR